MTMGWILVLNMHVMSAKDEASSKRQIIEIKGFSTKQDCEKAAEAAGEIFMLRDGEQNGLLTDCKKV